MFAYHSVISQDRLGSVQIPISFYFGDKDWMLRDGVEDFVKNNPYYGTHSHYFVVPGSDHHMYWDNPEEFVNILLHDLSNVEELLVL
jgi:pimeloyl-ACP methyl ester carboxylesterase